MKNFLRKLVSDVNDINERYVVGVISLGFLLGTVIFDIIASFVPNAESVPEVIYYTLGTIVLASFGLKRIFEK